MYRETQHLEPSSRLGPLQALEAVAATPAGKALIANAAKLHNVLAYHAIKPATIVPTFKGKGTENFETLAGVPVTVTKVRRVGAGRGARGRVEGGSGGA
jgi:hypothetical protein